MIFQIWGASKGLSGLIKAASQHPTLEQDPPPRRSVPTKDLLPSQAAWQRRFLFCVWALAGTPWKPSEPPLPSCSGTESGQSLGPACTGRFRTQKNLKTVR